MPRQQAVQESLSHGLQQQMPQARSRFSKVMHISVMRAAAQLQRPAPVPAREGGESPASTPAPRRLPWYRGHLEKRKEEKERNYPDQRVNSELIISLGRLF